MKPRKFQSEKIEMQIALDEYGHIECDVILNVVPSPASRGEYPEGPPTIECDEIVRVLYDDIPAPYDDKKIRNEINDWLDANYDFVISLLRERGSIRQ